MIPAVFFIVYTAREREMSKVWYKYHGILVL